MIGYLLATTKGAIFFLLSFILFIESVYAEKMKVAFINPTYPNEPFWGLLTDFMASAAKDLDVELQVYYSQSNRFKTLEIAQEILKSPNKPDYMVFHFQAQMGARILQAAEEAKVYSFVINTNVPETDAQDIGKPRGKFKYWLGHLVPDDQQAGYLLASELIEKAIELKKVAEDGKVHMFGLTGTTDNTASINRNTGLKEFVDKRSDVILHQIVNTSWNKEKAAKVTKILMARYPETSVIWSASDAMALGAIQSLEALNLRVGKDVLLGGIDGTPAGLKAVNDGKMVATMSGHFIEGAWAIVLLYDHYYGVDFANDLGLAISDPYYINQIDFKFFSKVANPKRKQYQFTLPDSLVLN